MALENKLGLTSSADLAREEERISKKKALELFESIPGFGDSEEQAAFCRSKIEEIKQAPFVEKYKKGYVNTIEGNVGGKKPSKAVAKKVVKRKK